MRRAWASLLVAAMLAPAVAHAGNSDEVNAGIDVTLTGGAVVATTYTGASLWYNPAGLARIDKASFELTGVTLQMQIVARPQTWRWPIQFVDPTRFRHRRSDVEPGVKVLF